jgi:hypothetical protein
MSEQAKLEGWDVAHVIINRDPYTAGKPWRGKIAFQNKGGEEVSFNIPADKMQAIIALVAESTMDAAKRIGIDISKIIPQVLMQTALPPAEPIEEEKAEDLAF